ncbi:MAG: hypothetical protein ABSG41_05145, partial [Bryobacteraceae bacterium]
MKCAILSIVTVALAVGHIASGEVASKSKTIAGMKVEYKVILPEHFDPAKSYPAVYSIRDS